MNLINHTPHAVTWFCNSDQSGRQRLIVVVKATYELPVGGGSVRLAEQQPPVYDTDSSTSELGLSAPHYESDLCWPKSDVDVLLLGSAYSVNAKPVRKLNVGLQIGEIRKGFVVTGECYWRQGLLGSYLSQADFFVRQSISYDIAYGGSVPESIYQDDEPITYLANPVGRGYWPKGLVPDGLPAAQTHEIGNPIIDTISAYRPMSFGPIGRHWSPRYKWAGTYDEEWRDNQFPLLPLDFDRQYLQSVPADQRLSSVSADQQVYLLNLTPPSLAPRDGIYNFTLPDLSPPVRLNLIRGGPLSIDGRVDTIVIEPDAGTLTLCWRAAYSFDRYDIYDFSSVEVGQRPQGLLIRIPLETLAGELPSRQVRGNRQ